MQLVDGITCIVTKEEKYGEQYWITNLQCNDLTLKMNRGNKKKKEKKEMYERIVEAISLSCCITIMANYHNQFLLNLGNTPDINNQIFNMKLSRCSLEENYIFPIYLL